MSESSFALRYASIAEIGRAIRSGSITPTRLAEEALSLLDTEGRRLNAVTTLTVERALADAKRAETELAAGRDRGPLHGVPYVAKDLLATAGYPTTWGAEPLREQTFRHDAAVIERLDNGGAVLVAKAAMVELAGGFGYHQPNAALTGPGRNAWDADRWSGGSSSGSGSIVGAGLVPFAIGSETWGSITNPACYNGVTGLRPTYGLVSRRGAMALSWTMDKIGPLARSAADCALVLAAIAGHDPDDAASANRPPPRPVTARDDFRFGVLRDATERVDDGVAATFQQALETIGAIGSIEEVELPDLPFGPAASAIISAECAAAFEDFVDQGLAQGLTAPEDRTSVLPAFTMPAVTYLRALRVRRLAGRALDDLLAGFDALLAPTQTNVAPPVDQDFGSWLNRKTAPTLGAAGNLCGLPSITVPNGFGEHGLPTGLEMMGRAYAEDRILAAAIAFQSRTDWHHRRPSA